MGSLGSPGVPGASRGRWAFRAGRAPGWTGPQGRPSWREEPGERAARGGADGPRPAGAMAGVARRGEKSIHPQVTASASTKAT